LREEGFMVKRSYSAQKIKTQQKKKKKKKKTNKKPSLEGEGETMKTDANAKQKGDKIHAKP